MVAMDFLAIHACGTGSTIDTVAIMEVVILSFLEALVDPGVVNYRHHVLNTV